MEQEACPHPPASTLLAAGHEMGGKENVPGLLTPWTGAR